MFQMRSGRFFVKTKTNPIEVEKDNMIITAGDFSVVVDINLDKSRTNVKLVQLPTVSS